MNQVDSTGAPPVWLPDGLVGAWTVLAGYPWLLALTVAGAGVVLALVARSVLLFWGLKVAARTRTYLDENMIRLVAGVAAIILVYLGAIAAVRVLPLGDASTTTATRLLVTLLVIHLMGAALKASGIALAILGRLGDRFAIVEERTIPLFDLLLTVLIVAFASYMLLQVWRVDATAWLASAGVVGIAVGFAAKDTLANLISGFAIVADAPYGVGDYVVLDTGERGEVTRLGIRSTRIITRDDVEVVVPNSLMANTKIVNESGGERPGFRIRVQVGVAHGSDADRVTALLTEIAARHDTVCRDPEPRVRMRGFSESGLLFELLCWVFHPSERGAVSHELYMDIYRTMRAEGIEIPVSRSDVRVRELPEGASKEAS